MVVLGALRRFQRAGTDKQGHVMGSQGSVSCQELHLAMVSLGSGAAGTWTCICSLVPYSFPVNNGDTHGEDGSLQPGLSGTARPQGQLVELF